jgi:hypothetical protein
MAFPQGGRQVLDKARQKPLVGRGQICCGGIVVTIGLAKLQL